MVAEKLATTSIIEDQETIQKHTEGNNFTSPSFLVDLFCYFQVVASKLIDHNISCKRQLSFVNFPENEQHQISSDLNADEDDGYCALNNDVKFWQAFTKEETK